jgi:hypothetical protein
VFCLTVEALRRLKMGMMTRIVAVTVVMTMTMPTTMTMSDVRHMIMSDRANMREVS